MSKRYPAWIENANPRWRQRWKDWWDKPWTVPATSSKAVGFKKQLWAHGHVSVNFMRSEAASKNRRGPVSVPDSLRNECQYHGFRLERVRHACGNKSMTPLSWYRDPVHNREVGGATQSAHLSAFATDWDDGTRARLGATRFDDACHRVFRNGGIGVVGNTRHVRHVDNGAARRWSY